MMDAIMLLIAMLNDVKTRQIKLYEDYTSNKFECLSWDDSIKSRQKIRQYYMVEGEIHQLKKEVEDLEKLLKDLEKLLKDREGE